VKTKFEKRERESANEEKKRRDNDEEGRKRSARLETDTDGEDRQSASDTLLEAMVWASEQIIVRAVRQSIAQRTRKFGRLGGGRDFCVRENKEFTVPSGVRQCVELF